VRLARDNKILQSAQLTAGVRTPSSKPLHVLCARSCTLTVPPLIESGLQFGSPCRSISFLKCVSLLMPEDPPLTDRTCRSSAVLTRKAGSGVFAAGARSAQHG